MGDARKSEFQNAIDFMSRRKSLGIGYLLLILLGGLGCHRFYCAHDNEDLVGALQLCGTILGWLFIFFGHYLGIGIMSGIGILMVISAAVSVFIDLFLLPSVVKKNNLILMQKFNVNPSALI